MYLTQGLHRAVQRYPERLALCHIQGETERRLTFAALVDAVARRAAALRALGVAPGERVVLLGPNDDRLVLGLLACWWLGAVACPLNTRWSGPELHHALADCGARLAFADAELAPLLQGLGDDVAVHDLNALGELAEAHTPMEDSRTGGEALAAILYTGGTTGKSKGVMLTHTNLWAGCLCRAAELNNPPDSISLLVAPLFHVAGLARLVGQCLCSGACVTLAQFRPESALNVIQSLRITDTIMVPTMMQALLDAPGFAPQRVQSLNRIAFGAAPMPPDLLRRALSVWPHAEFFQAYGLTETSGAVCINLPENHRDPGRVQRLLRSVGRAGMGSEIRIVDSNGADCPAGTVGEIVVRGPMVTQGYWRQPETTARAFRDGWFLTGDGGRMDEDGYIFIEDRLKDMIISGGENVYPAEVEAALREHPAVAEAAVIGVPHAYWGEAVHAVIVLREPAVGDDALVEALQAFCRTQLAGFKCPRTIAFTPALPLSAAGKILKTSLRAAHGAQRAA